MDLTTLYHRTVECWAFRVNDVRDDQWAGPTPCSEWTVRDLVNHVAGEDLWTVPLMQGYTLAEVGDRFDGDVLGDRPVTAALDAAKEAVSAVAERLPREGRVHLSYGDEDAAEYVRQLAADHLIHAWDLAAATGGDTRFDPHLLAQVADWFADRAELMRSIGIIGPPASGSGDLQSDLLAAAGRESDWGAHHALLARFRAAFADRDAERIMQLMTDDCVFESTAPAPDGVRHEGAAEVRHVWEQLFEQTQDASFSAEESIVCKDRGVLRWRFSWTEDDGSSGHVRGVDVLRFRDGKVSEKLSYVKG
jgi:uncharacterized protein (TIGR03086 family)